MDRQDIEATSRLLQAYDDTADFVQRHYAKIGLPEKEAKQIVNALDQRADAIEKRAFGEESFEKRKAFALRKNAADRRAKLAEVLQKESDEPYMSTYKNPMKPLEVNSDEPYMRQYADDQSSGVIHGKASNGRALAPGH
jgi:hypothetical protein